MSLSVLLGLFLLFPGMVLLLFNRQLAKRIAGKHHGWDRFLDSGFRQAIAFLGLAAVTFGFLFIYLR